MGRRPVSSIIIPLAKTDRCDCRDCSAEARVRVVRDGLDLVFCAHHFAKLADALFLDGWEINDDTRSELTLRPADVDGH